MHALLSAERPCVLLTQARSIVVRVRTEALESGSGEAERHGAYGLWPACVC